MLKVDHSTLLTVGLIFCNLSSCASSLHRLPAPPTLRCRVSSAATNLLALMDTFTGVFGYGGIALVMVIAAPELVMPFAGC